MKSEIKKFLYSLILAFATLSAPLVWEQNQIFAIGALALTSFLMLSIDWNYKNFFFYIVVFISGPMAEIFAIYNGAWTYTHPVILGIPLWLPFVWGNAGLFFIRIRNLIYSIN